MNQEIMRPINRKMNTLTKYVVSVFTAFTLFVVGAAATKAYTDTSNMTDAVFFSKINLDYPGLGTVKTHVANGNYTSAKASLLTYFQNRTSPVYFAMGTTPVTAPLRSTADELVNYEFHFTDGQSQTFTGGINWNYHWNPAQPTAFGGPHYYVMDFMMNSVLAPSYNALSVSDPKRAIYADTWMDFSLDYIADVGNLLTFSTGNNQLDMAKRLASWTSTYSLLKNSTVIDANGNAAYLKHLWEMTDMLYDGIEGTSGNNWYMSIAWSIYGAGAYFPEFKDAESWRMRSEGATYKYMAKNMKGDGMNIEPAENYHLYSLSLANRLQKLAAMNGYTVLQDLSELLERGGEVLMDLSLPNFEMPLIGDTASKSMDITGFMSDYSGYYGRDDFEFIATKGAAGTVPNKSVFYPNSFAIMKTGWNTNDKYMVIENEDTDYTGSHNHPDDLSLMMYAFGKRLIVDPGVNNYNNIASSNWLRQSTRAHNTIEVSNSPQGNLNRSAIKWLSNDGFDFYHGRHQDYLPINHNRKVFFAKPDFWIVSDLMTGGTTSETYRQLWHFMPTTVSLDATTKRASTSFSGEANVKVVPADPSTLTATVQTDGYYSHTGDVVQSNVQYLSFGRTATGTTSFDTVLYPEPNGSNKNVTVTRLTTGVAASVATALEIGHDTGNSGNISAYYLSHETNPGTRSFGAYNYNGELAYIEKTSGGSLVSTSIAKGTLLKDGTTNLISATATVQNLSVRYSGATLNLYSSDLLTPSITIYAPGVTSVKLNDSTITFSVSGNFITVGGAAIPTTGTTVLTDDFDIVGLTSQNWDFEDSLETGWKEVVGTWSIDTQGGSKVYRESNSAGLSKAVVTESKWSDVLVQSDVTTVGANGSYNGVGLYARYQDSTNNYLFQYYTNGGTPQLQIVKNFNGTSTVLANISFTMTTNTKYTLKAVVSGNVLKFYVDNVLKLTAYDSDVFMGYSGLYAHRRDAYFDNVKVTELADGDKWKVGKGHFLINSYELYSDSLNEANSEISSKVQNDWKDTLAEAKVKVAAWGAAPGRAGIVTRSLGGNDGYRFIVYNDGTARKLRIERVVSGLRADATPVVLAEKAYTFNTGTFYTFKAVADGGILKFYVNGTEELTAYDTLLSKGGFSLHASKAQVRFDDVLVKTIP